MKSIFKLRTRRVLGIVLMAAAWTVAAEELPKRISAERDLENAGQIMDRMFSSVPHTAQEKETVEALLKDASGFAAFNLAKTGIGVTQIHGRGVLVYRDAKGVWQPPLPLLVSGSGVGPHFAMISYDLLVPLKKPVDVEDIFSRPLVLGGKEVIGPLPAADTAQGELTSYARGKGLSTGVSQDNVRVTLDQQAISALYGIQIEPHELFSGKMQYCRKPLPAQKLLEKANERATGAPLTTIWSSP